MTETGAPETIAPDRAEPRVFVKGLQAPPGLPWDQRAAAQMEAQRTAPAPIPGLAIELRRVEPWRPGRPAEFVALYAHRSEIGTGLSAVVELGGRRMKATFASPAARLAQVQQKVVLGVLIFALGVLITTAVWSAIQQRFRIDRDLTAIELAGRRQHGLALRSAQTARGEAALRRLVNGRVPIEEALATMGLAVRERSQAASVEAIHWRRAGTGLEVRGDEPLYSPDKGVRTAEPLRPGVWLWVYTPQRPAVRKAP